MKKLLIFSLALLLGYGILAGCSAVKEPAPDVPDEPKEETKKNEYKQITQSKAKALMDSETNYIILDTREQYEFDEGHIAGAILIPYTEIEAKAFQNCKFIARLDLPKGLRRIGAGAFAHCRDLFDVFIPESVTSMEKGVFAECDDLRVISAEAATQPQGWDSEWLAGCYAKVDWGSTDE